MLKWLSKAFETVSAAWAAQAAEAAERWRQEEARQNATNPRCVCHCRKNKHRLIVLGAQIVSGPCTTVFGWPPTHACGCQQFVEMGGTHAVSK